ncbi:hypothetical protein PAMA_020207 [Pampus argenteus]
MSSSSSVRNFGSAGTLIQGLNSSGHGAVFKDCNMVDGPLVAKHFYDRSTEYLKCDSMQWEDFAKVQRTYVATSESLPGSSTTGACKFIKDENEPSVIMDTPCPNFDPSSEIPVLDTCCDTDRKQQQLGLSDGEAASFTPATSGPRPGLEGSPNFLIDLNQTEQLPALSLVRTDSGCGLSGKAVINYDANTGQQLMVYKNEIPRWQMQTSPAEPQYWCHSAGMTEDPFTHSGYNMIQNQALSQRNPSPFTTFPGKLKRFGALKALGLAPSLMFQSHLAMSSDSQALTTMSCIPGIREVQLSQQIINILENIEPDTVYSGYDSAQSDIPHLLLNSLNRLCEKQLLWIVKWSKSLPGNGPVQLRVITYVAMETHYRAGLAEGFRNLHINDQMTLIQYSWMNLMVFALGWRSYQNVTSEFLYFAPDLVLSQEQMRRSPIYDLCLAIQFIPQEFANLQVSREEFLCMKAIILLNTVPLEGVKSQAAFEEMRQNYIRELTKAIHIKEKGMVASSQRFYHLTKLMDAMHDIVKKVNLFCLSTFIQADAMKVEFPEMMTEVIASQLPKVLAGMVRPLLFHTK